MMPSARNETPYKDQAEFDAYGTPMTWPDRRPVIDYRDEVRTVSDGEAEEEGNAG